MHSCLLLTRALQVGRTFDRMESRGCTSCAELWGLALLAGRAALAALAVSWARSWAFFGGLAFLLTGMVCVTWCLTTSRTAARTALFKRLQMSALLCRRLKGQPASMDLRAAGHAPVLDFSARGLHRPWRAYADFLRETGSAYYVRLLSVAGTKYSPRAVALWWNFSGRIQLPARLRSKRGVCCEASRTKAHVAMLSPAAEAAVLPESILQARLVPYLTCRMQPHLCLFKKSVPRCRGPKATSQAGLLASNRRVGGQGLLPTCQ